MNTKRLRTVAYWLTTIFGPASFVIGGTLHLARTPEVMATLQHLGYPAYFAWILGAWKLAGAIVIAAPGLPRLKEWAYAGFVFDLTAAAASRAACTARSTLRRSTPGMVLMALRSACVGCTAWWSAENTVCRA